MGFRFRKSMSLGKFAKINVSKSGVGMSVGVPGFRVGVGGDGKVRRTVGIPGSGISHTQVIADTRAKASRGAGAPEEDRPGARKRAQRAERECYACGKTAGAADRFCRYCGARL